jgi:hypothetical protein
VAANRNSDIEVSLSFLLHCYALYISPELRLARSYSIRQRPVCSELFGRPLVRGGCSLGTTEESR